MTKNKLVLVRNKGAEWEDKTDEIAEYLVVQAAKRFEIRFKSRPDQWFSYSFERVRELTDVITTHNPIEVQLRVKGRVLWGVDAIVKYPDFYIVTSQGRRKPYAASEVGVERNLAVDPGCRTALNYFRQLSELAGAQNDEDQSLLTKQFSYLEKVSDASILAKYLMPDAGLGNLEVSKKTLIYPFGTNVSQKIAVEKTFQSQAVFVQGPPGTGKTQTILNIIANAIYLGQTVAVVSNNNTAIQNVAVKLEAKGLGFMLAKLGRRDNKEAFIEFQSTYPDWVKQRHEKNVDFCQLESHLESLLTSLDQLIQANNDRATIVAKLEQVKKEFLLHRRLEGTTPSKNALDMLDQFSARDWLNFQIECEETNINSRIGLLGLIKQIFLYGPWGLKKRRKLFGEGPLVLRSLYYEKYLNELENELSGVERILAEKNFESVRDNVQEISWRLLREVISQRYRKQKERPQFTSRELWSKYDMFINYYPVILSTTHSIKTSLSPECLYDLIIVDEASQVDVATGVLALSCAKRAVIVGDEKQLPNVVQDEVKRQASDLWIKYELNRPAWNFATHSLLSSAKLLWPQAPDVLLKEHYRCHPKIAGFFNKKFYDNQLIIMTVDHGETDAIQVVFTAPGDHARGRINQRQSDVILHEIQPELIRKGLADIGVIAPYKAQVAMLKEVLGTGIEVATVHGFQGREKQAIIMSTVDNEIGEFVDDPKMLNVAVSRAQRSFTVIMSDDRKSFDTNFGDLVRYIRYHQQLVKNSQIRSVFDLLYAEYADARKRFLDANGRTSIWDSESLAETVILGVLGAEEFSSISLSCMRHVPLTWLIGDLPTLTDRERNFVLHPWAHVDFLIYDTFGKQPILGIEVDGWAFHRPGSLQSERDEIKNSVFQRANLPMLRLSTTGSCEDAVISEALRNALGLNRVAA
jgi:hypothetical protein